MIFYSFYFNVPKKKNIVYVCYIKCWGVPVVSIGNCYIAIRCIFVFVYVYIEQTLRIQYNIYGIGRFGIQQQYIEQILYRKESKQAPHARERVLIVYSTKVSLRARSVHIYMQLELRGANNVCQKLLRHYKTYLPKQQQQQQHTADIY